MAGEFDTMMAQIAVVERPLKVNGDTQVTSEQLDTQAHHARDCLEMVNYDEVRGTCPDERPRVGLLNGEPTVETRPSAFGGPNIYGLYMAEMSGYFGTSDGTGEERLRLVTQQINRNGVKSGGHKDCKANAGVPDVFTLIADPANRAAFESYARQEIGEDYDQTASDEAINYAHVTVASSRYAGWDESVLETVLADEAGDAIQVLAAVPHTGKSVVKVKSGNATVPQTKLHEQSGGEDSFILTDPYMDRIENALASGPEAARRKVIMRHARELLNAAIYAALPNQELHQININAQ